ncbi:MAG TPA: NapC/NirT family cytochrome c, partial [Propionicimonas sp.]|nr:NapC/NirT family cytochrome c [Propionicimonas sp.]
MSRSRSASTTTPKPRGRLRRLLDRIPIPRPDTKRGAIFLILAVLAVGAAVTLAGVHVVEYSGSTAFCTQLCHTMEPQKKAHAASTHSEVECGSCHVAPGVYGFVKAKLEGTHELFALITNTYPRPIPAIEHSKLPSTTVTCQACHPLATRRPASTSRTSASPRSGSRTTPAT